MPLELSSLELSEDESVVLPAVESSQPASLSEPFEPESLDPEWSESLELLELLDLSELLELSEPLGSA